MGKGLGIILQGKRGRTNLPNIRHLADPMLQGPSHQVLNAHVVSV
jgi:hypothetical protein